jgi:hypothetical protein
MTDTRKVFHFTTSSHLPLIVASRQLVPNRDEFGGEDNERFPSTTLLWATTKARGDWSVPSIVRSQIQDEYEWGLVHLVRFTLRAEDFEPWSKVITRCPQWSPEQIRYVKTYPNWKAWRCRAEPLPLEQWITVEIKAYRGPWQPYDYRNPDPVMDAAVQAYLTEQAILSKQPDYECPECGDTIKAIDVNDVDDIECPSCGWEGERQDCKLCTELTR